MKYNQSTSLSFCFQFACLFRQLTCKTRFKRTPHTGIGLRRKVHTPRAQRDRRDLVAAMHVATTRQGHRLKTAHTHCKQRLRFWSVSTLSATGRRFTAGRGSNSEMTKRSKSHNSALSLVVWGSFFFFSVVRSLPRI